MSTKAIKHKKRIYKQVYSGEWFPVRWKDQVIECCDCSLIHKLTFRVRKGILEIKSFRDNRATGQRRRRAGIKVTGKRASKRK